MRLMGSSFLLLFPARGKKEAVGSILSSRPAENAEGRKNVERRINSVELEKDYKVKIYIYM